MKWYLEKEEADKINRMIEERRRKKENGCRFNLRRERSDLHPLIKMHNALRAHRFRVHYVFSEEI